MTNDFMNWVINNKVKVIKYDETITYTLLKSSLVTVIGANHTYHLFKH
jgi:hypothetical protein